MADDGLVLNFGVSTEEETPRQCRSKSKRRVGFYEAKKKRIAERKARSDRTTPKRSDKSQDGNVLGDERRVPSGLLKKQPLDGNGSLAPKHSETEEMEKGHVNSVLDIQSQDDENDNDADDIMAAVQIAITRDKAFEEDQSLMVSESQAIDENGSHPSSASDIDADGVVEFMTQQQYEVASTRQTKRNKRTIDKAVAEPTQTASARNQNSNRKGGITSMRTEVGVQEGQLVHSAVDLDEQERKELFGDVDGRSFRGLALAESLCSHLEDINFCVPTKTQVASIPWLLKGRDALINAPTGSGKTLAYLAPIVHSLQEQSERLHRSLGTHAIVIAPTRELVVQINDVLLMILRRYHWLVGGMLMGGEQRSKEKARLRKGIMVLTATPGRLLDHLQNTESFRTSELKWFVMDEADRLLDLGFEKKMEEILSIIDNRLEQARTGSRQTVLMSATMHSNLHELVSLSLHQPVMIGFRSSTISDDNDDMLVPLGDSVQDDSKSNAEPEAPQMYRIPATLRQSFMEVPCKLRSVALLAYISAKYGRGKKTKMVIFLASCDTVDFTHELVARQFGTILGPEATPAHILKLHGNMAQSDRFKSFLSFQKHDSALLLCTDVAARGLDFPEVSCIVQFESPGPVAEYVHRVGRTARMGRKGEAMLFLLPSELEYSTLLGNQGLVVNKEELLHYFEMMPLPPNYIPTKRAGKATAETCPLALVLQQRLMAAVASSKFLQDTAKDAFRTFLRAYSTHSRDLKPIFHPKRLHLGHLAQSFCLKDTPTMVGQAASKAEKNRRKKASAMKSSSSRSGKLTHAGGKRKRQGPTAGSGAGSQKRNDIRRKLKH